ncbi:hypothetical protein [Xanthomonas campestris]|uniref:hypothetical protein n=1 Tax=Xanthomonas campestris TaxID=339 RepID=UPI002E141D8C
MPTSAHALLGDTPVNEAVTQYPKPTARENIAHPFTFRAQHQMCAHEETRYTFTGVTRFDHRAG